MHTLLYLTIDFFTVLLPNFRHWLLDPVLVTGREHLYRAYQSYHPLLELILEVSKSTAIDTCRLDNKQNRCELGMNVKVRTSTLDEVRHTMPGNGLCML